MHPLNRQHDNTAFDKHEEKPARRSSLDNSCLQDKQKILKVIKGSNCLDSSSHGPTHQRRRLSLNNTLAKATTFMMSTVPADLPPKTELDMDHHVGEDEQDDEYDNNSAFEFQSSSGDLSRHVISEDEEDKHEESSSVLSDGDSFCEAQETEPADKDYIAKDLGASCYWNEEDGDEGITDDELAEFEALENGEHEITENGLENLREVTDEHSDDCDSFCDATDKEPANQAYLIQDLGASCFFGPGDCPLDVGMESPKRSTRLVQGPESQ